MTSLALLMFNLEETEGIVRNVRRLRSSVDEVVVVDSSSPRGYRELVAALAPYEVRVHRALPLGDADPLHPFGVSRVTSDRVLLLDADEEPSPALVADLPRLTDHAAYVVPRYEEGLRTYTFHLRLFRRGAVRYLGRSFDFPEVEGSLGHLDRAHAILHHARYDTYLADKARAVRYFTVEGYERPFNGRYLADALTLPLPGRRFRVPVPARNTDDPLSPAAVRAAVELEFLRDLGTGRGLRAARFNRRYSLAKAAFFQGLPAADQAQVAAIAAEIQAAGGLFPYLGLADPTYVERLTATFGWDRTGLTVYEELLRHRHARGAPAERVPADAARVPPPERASEPRVSVVIPTHDRPDQLRALLASLQAVASERLDAVIVVDDSASPVDVAREFPRLRIEHLVLDRRAFISRAKNLGWRAARSPFVFFIDDDNVVTRETLEGPLARMAESPEVAAVVPAVLYKARPDLVWVYATPLAPGRWGHVLIGRNRPRDAALEGRLYDTDALPNAALVRREALEAIGGFREILEVNSSADAALRLKAVGWRVLADSGTFILHDVEPPGRAGWWARHGAADPDRVFHEVRDWFVLMHTLHGDERLFPLRATWHALGFLLPNGVTYLVRGGPRGRRAFGQLLRGYVTGLRATARSGASAP